MEQELEFLEYDDVIDWSNLFHELPEGASILDWETEASILNHSSPLLSSSSSSSSPPLAADHSPDSLSTWIGEIETLLMKEDDADADDDYKVASESPANDFLADVLVNSPAQASDDHNLGLSTDKEELEVAPLLNDSEDADDDHLSKKRRRYSR